MPAKHTLSILSRDVEQYSRLAQSEPALASRLIQVASSPQELDPQRVEILLSEPDLAVQVIPECPNLVWLQSTWSGNAPLLKLTKRNYVLTAAKGIFNAAIREYVLAYLLYFTRNMPSFHPRQGDPEHIRPRQWQPPQIDTLANKRIGILGAGSMASALVPVLRGFSATILGLNRSGQSTDEYTQMYAFSDLHQFLAKLDFLVVLLPDTPDTQHLLNQQTLALLPAHCVLINAGRGSTIDDQALLNALDQNRLGAAVLDVFAQEPLPSEHPYWQHPKVWITHHTAAISDPNAVFQVFNDNFQRWSSHQPLNYQIDFNRGY
ncbi:D-2-hydroxyacid dehydrogenase [Alteromonas flava]|uniref:D-2-hydroxyacid dehydrogenase n=1 Tax=Alteromonas flava TaxID=2048003 RepID=UPI000C2837D4|nr:D-2-hydroxyacid dehydrogenase [Alteromonas flava]